MEQKKFISLDFNFDIFQKNGIDNSLILKFQETRTRGY
jgi:hypothetical protein